MINGISGINKVYDLLEQSGHSIPGVSMRVALVRLTPDLCQQILDHHHIENNRTKKTASIRQYQIDMEAGRWTVTHQGIAFNEDGLLTDGQHRLEACISAGVPFHTLAFFGVPSATMSKLDTGVTRTMNDINKTCNLGLTNALADAAICKWLDMDDISQQRAKLSPATIMEIADANADILDFVHKCLPTSIKYLTVAPVLGAIGRAFLHEDKQRLTEFCDVLKTMQVKSKEDSAAIALIRYLTSGGNRKEPKESYRKAQRAIHAFCRREPITRLHAGDVELYPMPEGRKVVQRDAT